MVTFTNLKQRTTGLLTFLRYIDKHELNEGDVIWILRNVAGELVELPLNQSVEIPHSIIQTKETPPQIEAPKKKKYDPCLSCGRVDGRMRLIDGVCGRCRAKPQKKTMMNAGLRA